MKTLSCAASGFLACLLTVQVLSATAADSISPIPRVLPPEGLEIPAEVRAKLETRLAATKKLLETLRDAELIPDIEVLTKAVELAIAHREFYVERDFAKADWALDQANQRLDDCAQGKRSWQRATGTLVRGYRSTIDNSAQPYGLVIPAGHDFENPCPLYVWLHGRGDKNTDLHFLSERANRPGQITPPGAIVVHPFGRHCVGWKHAGEIDVLEVVASVKQRYKIDDDRIVLIGFSMGGAGAWHIGAHYTDRWVAVCPGAGFVDTARYQKITPDRYPEGYVQKLWGLYDVPAYVRNLFNTNVIAYSGELDPQRQAAVLMEEAFQSEGRTLTHLIGPGVEHKYEPETLKELLRRVSDVVVQGRDTTHKKVQIQTRTLRYPGLHWVSMRGMEEHWKEARIEAELLGQGKVELSTKNASVVQLARRQIAPQLVNIDGNEISISATEGDSETLTFLKHGNKWQYDPAYRNTYRMAKTPGLQGPIDDAFLSWFVVVVPSGKSKNPAFQAWVDFELAHFQDRWRALMRAELPFVYDRDFHLEAWNPGMNVVLWGDADSNSVIKHLADALPVKFEGTRWSFGGQTYDGNRFAPVLITPSPPSKRDNGYIVLNSGLTFREGHDRTNSQQNPKLPDWAIIDISQPPDAQAPGKILDADFFDEKWQLKRQPKAP